MVEETPAEALFESLKDWPALEDLIENAEPEGQYLECKSPAQPHIGQDLRGKTSRAFSAFTNTGGGVLVFGLATDNHVHSGLDVVTQIEPIGQVTRFSQRLVALQPRLTTPSVRGIEVRVIRRMPKDSKGVLVVHVPPSAGDPVQAEDSKFYIRTGDENSEMPFEVIKRMFAGSVGPDIEVEFDDRLVTRQDGIWTIPIVLINRSSAAARDVAVTVAVMNPESCEQVTGTSQDLSAVNPGMTIFGHREAGPIYRGLNFVGAELRVKMKTGKRKRRVLVLKITVMADRMRGKYWNMTVQLAGTGFSVRKTDSGFLY